MPRSRPWRATCRAASKPLGQGLANLTAGLFSGYPGSGSLHPLGDQLSGGRQNPLERHHFRRAVALTVLVAAPLAAHLPVAALAGALLVISIELIKVADSRRAVRSTRNNAAVLGITFLSTVLLSIEFAVYVGVLLSIGLHLKTTSHPRITSTVPDLISGKMVAAAHGKMCCQMDIVRIEGSIFFGSSDFVLDDLQRRLKSHPHMSCLLIRMHQVNNFDASGVHVLEQIVAQLGARGGGLYFSGVNARVFQVFTSRFIEYVLRIFSFILAFCYRQIENNSSLMFCCPEGGGADEKCYHTC